MRKMQEMLNLSLANIDRLSPLELAWHWEEFIGECGSNLFAEDPEEVKWVRFLPWLKEGKGKGTAQTVEAVLGMRFLFRLYSSELQPLREEFYSVFGEDSLWHKHRNLIEGVQKSWSPLARPERSKWSPWNLHRYLGIEIEPGNREEEEVRSHPSPSMLSLRELLLNMVRLMRAWEKAGHLPLGYYVNLHWHLGVEEQEQELINFKQLSHFLAGTCLFQLPLGRLIYSPNPPPLYPESKIEREKHWKENYRYDEYAYQSRVPAVSAWMDVDTFLDELRFLDQGLARHDIAEPLAWGIKRMEALFEKAGFSSKVLRDPREVIMSYKKQANYFAEVSEWLSPQSLRQNVLRPWLEYWRSQ